METIYKIICIENQEVKNLFKGIEGTRILPTNKWLKAEKKMGRDGGNSRWYLTGIHCLKDKEKAEDYLNNFRTEKERIIIKAKGRGLRQKPTNENVYLADEIMIPKNNLEKALTKNGLSDIL